MIPRWKSESEVVQSCLTLCDPIEGSHPWDFPGKYTGVVAISFSRVSSQLRDRMQVSHTAGRLFTIWASKGTAFKSFGHIQFSSVQSLSRVRLFATSRLQHIRSPCPSPTPRVYSKSCPLSRWCYPTISHSVIPFSSCLQSFPALGSFPISGLFISGGQSIGVSASVLPMNIQDWLPLGWTGWISLQSKGLSTESQVSIKRLKTRVFSNTIVQKHQFFVLSFLYSPNLTSIHDNWKNHSLE